MTVTGLHGGIVQGDYNLFSPGVVGRLCRSLLLALSIFLLVSCGTQKYNGADVDTASFLRRSLTLADGPLRVTAAVPDADETRALTGLDLYSDDIQPVWLKVENNGSTPARISLWSVDRNYYSPIEVAYMNRKPFSGNGYADMERWFYDNGLTRFVPPGESRSGLVFTHLVEGTKGFNLDIVSNRVSHSFTFFVPMPGFVADYMEVDFAALYDDSEIEHFDPYSLKVMLEEHFACCSEGPDGTPTGGPLNVVLVGTPLAVRRSLLRGGWHETPSGSEETQRAREHRYRGRSPDAVFYRVREDGNERMTLHIWRSPWEVDGEPGWVGQVYYKVFEQNLVTEVKSGAAIRDSAFLSRFVRESVAADLDGAQHYLMQNFWYNQSLRKVGIVTGAGKSTPERPGVTFDGVGYFTEGNRVVLFLSEAPVALGDTKVLYGREYLRFGGADR